MALIKKEHISKFIAATGLGSRRSIDKLITEKRVILNGNTIDSPAGILVNEDDKILVDGKSLPGRPTFPRIWLYNKPRGLIVSHSDPQGRETVFDIIKKEHASLPRVMSIGRLDVESEGLLLLTNMSEVAHHLESPDLAWERRYRVKINGNVDQVALDKLANGVTINGFKYKPIKALLEEKAVTNNWIHMTLTEGKNREIRNIASSFGWKVSRLIRIGYGPYSLTKLLPGEIREISSDAVKKDLTGIIPPSITMATFSVSFSHEVSPPATKRDFLVVAHNKEFFTSLKITSHLSVIAQLDDAELELIHHAAEHKLTQAAENVSSIELSFKVDGDKPGMRKFVFGILPSECSRINSSTRAHSISAFVKAQRGASENLFVYIVPKDLKHCLAQAVAAARAFPTFTRKTTGSPIASSFHIVLEPPFHIVESKIFTHEIESVINGVRLAQRLVDTPPNILHTSAYFSEVQATIERLHNPYAKIHTFIQGGDLEDSGFGGIWNVGKASEHPPVFVALSYLPPLSETKPVIALVGKGIVYDTGGLQIKTPGANMATMKTDMGGSAAVLGAFEALVANGSQIPVYALLCIAENSISAASFRNDDIITLLSGKTVEVNNTDAEGRLVLSDGVFFAASTLNASIIIDIATLTGAQPISTGKNHAGIYCSDEDLENVAVKVGKETGDLVFPLPYCPEFYRKEFSSQVADMKNSVADRSNAQSSCAAQFIGNHLEDFLADGGKWLHVDMAGPAFTADRATGYGVALLYGIVKHFERLHHKPAGTAVDSSTADK